MVSLVSEPEVVGGRVVIGVSGSGEGSGGLFKTGASGFSGIELFGVVVFGVGGSVVAVVEGKGSVVVGTVVVVSGGGGSIQTYRIGGIMDEATGLITKVVHGALARCRGLS